MPHGLEPVEWPADAVEVGRILDAWGVQGGFKVQPFSAQPEAMLCTKRWLIQPPERGPRQFEASGLLRIRQARQQGELIVAQAHDVEDRNAAEALRGARIFVSRQSFPTPEDGAFYWVDLMGCIVLNREGVLLGQVSDLLSNGPQSILVVRDTAPEPTQRLIPFVAVYVDSVDLAQKRIVVDWQPDY